MIPPRNKFDMMFLLAFVSLLSSSSVTQAFVAERTLPSFLRNKNHDVVNRRVPHLAPQASASSTTTTSRRESRRKELLSRRGNYFALDRKTGKIEFGATANLVTQLEEQEDDGTNKLELICDWLRDERGLALSIWDEKLITELPNSVYRLQIMTLQFVTLKLQPQVDVEMKTLLGKTNNLPVFCLQSVGFDPKIELLPGINFSAESLGVVIEVAGQLRPSNDNRGVAGAVAFSTSGILSLPLRLLPDAVLEAAANTINDTVVKFAVQSFREGARAKYKQAKIQKEVALQKKQQ